MMILSLCRLRNTHQDASFRIVALYILALVPDWLSDCQVLSYKKNPNNNKPTKLSLHSTLTPLNLFTVAYMMPSIATHPWFFSALLSPNERIKPISHENDFLNSTTFISSMLHCMHLNSSHYLVHFFPACVLHTYLKYLSVGIMGASENRSCWYSSVKQL